MKVHHIPFQNTGYFSSLITNYIGRNTELAQFYNNFPDLDGFKNQIEIKIVDVNKLKLLNNL